MDASHVVMCRFPQHRISFNSSNSLALLHLNVMRVWVWYFRITQNCPEWWMLSHTGWALKNSLQFSIWQNGHRIARYFCPQQFKMAEGEMIWQREILFCAGYKSSRITQLRGWNKITIQHCIEINIEEIIIGREQMPKGEPSLSRRSWPFFDKYFGQVLHTIFED